MLYNQIINWKVMTMYVKKDENLNCNSCWGGTIYISVLLKKHISQVIL